MKKKPSDGFVEFYNSGGIVYDETRHHHNITYRKKPSKHTERDLINIFSSFGGVEEKRFKWEFTYNPIESIQNAIDYGYYTTPKLNFPFLPSQIEKVLFQLMIVPKDGKVIYPFYGYGYSNEKMLLHDYDVDNSLRGESALRYDKYDGMLCRFPFFNIKEILLFFRKWTPLINSGGSVSCIVDSSWLGSNSFEDHLYSNYSDIGTATIPHQTWIPAYGVHKLKTQFLHMVRK